MELAQLQRFFINIEGSSAFKPRLSFGHSELFTPEAALFVIKIASLSPLVQFLDVYRYLSLFC